MVLAIRYVHFHPLQALPLYRYVALCISVGFVLLDVFVARWLYPLWRANTRDKEKSFAAAYSAQAILLDPTARPNLKTNDVIDISLRLFIRDWSMQFQALTTALLLVALCISARY